MTSAPIEESLLELAVELATGAGALTRKWFDRGTVAFDTKADGSPVTEADKAAERYLREQISLAFPTDAIIGEEEDDRGGTSGRTWIIDPIDGTKSFTNGVPLYGTLLAVTDEGGPAVGVIVLPALDEVVSAGRGIGCFHNGRQTTVNEKADLASSYVMTSGFEYWDDISERDRLLASGATTRTWGDAYGYVLLATGRCEVTVDPVPKLWDIAPMQVIIAEAGGMVSDQFGEPWQEGKHFVASNGAVHDDFLAATFASPHAHGEATASQDVAATEPGEHDEDDSGQSTEVPVEA